MTEREQWAKDAIAASDGIDSWLDEWVWEVKEEDCTEKSLKYLIGGLEALTRECIRLADTIPS